MLYRNLKVFISRMKEWGIGDRIATVALIFAVSVIGFHIYQINSSTPYLETVTITDPVQLTKDEYRLGETVSGVFEGERLVSKPTVFNRTLVCDDFRAILNPIRVEAPPVGPFEGSTPIVRLEGPIFVTPSTRIEPQTSCEIIFSNQTVVKKYILGGEELQVDQSYRTTSFDIVE